ncbi:hypothetical protein GCM10010398_71350 [Streptomyces fimbriatus]
MTRKNAPHSTRGGRRGSFARRRWSPLAEGGLRRVPVRKRGKLRLPHAAGERADPVQGVGGSPAEEEVERFRQEPEDEGDDGEGGESAGQEHRAPPVVVDEGDRRDAADRRAHGVPRGVETDGQTAPAAGGELAGDDVAAGENSADADAGEKAECSRLLPVLADRGEDHARGGDGQAGQDDRPSADSVAPGGDEQCAQGHSCQSAAEQEAEGAGIEMPFAGDGFPGEGHDQHVEAVEGVEEHA